MTTITIDRDTVEEWLEGFVNCDTGKDFVGYAIKAATMLRAALAKPARCAQCGYQYGHQIGCVNNPVDIALSKQAIRAELAKPEQEESFIPNWANYRQGVADGKAGSPKWHDAPTCAGLWLCDEGDDNPYRWTSHRVPWPLNPGLLGENERWLGPMPEDKL